jgi:hypothetical protein
MNPSLRHEIKLNSDVSYSLQLRSILMYKTELVPSHIQMLVPSPKPIYL